MAERLERLKQEYEEKLAQKEELRARSEDMELKLDRADKLVSGLAGEKARWEETVQVGTTSLTPWGASIAPWAPPELQGCFGRVPGGGHWGMSVPPALTPSWTGPGRGPGLCGG